MRYLIKILLIFVSICLNAQVDFEIRVSKKKLASNERLRIDFVMNENGDNFTPPSFSKFNLIAGPNQSISNSWINGKRTFSKTYTYFLSPKGKGIYKIGSAEITINGNIYKTKPISINVSDAVNKPSKTTSTEYLADENIHLVADISNVNPFLNEAISITYRLYFRDPIKISDAREIKSPKFQDFWTNSIDIPQLKVVSGNYNGESYNEVLWKKTVLYPQKNGKLTIEPLALNLVVEIPTKQRDFFGNIIYKQVTRSVTAGKKVLSVKDLPKRNKPDSFLGAVGEFSLDFLIEKKSLKVSESLEAVVKVSGTGNLKLFDLPDIKVPNSFELFEPEYNEKITTKIQGMSGNVKNTYTIVPNYPGKYPIPKIEFTYFDPKKESYQTLISSEHLIDVYGDESTSSLITKKNNVPNKQNFNFDSKQNFNFLKFKTDFQPIDKIQFWQKRYFWVLYFIPIIMLPIMSLTRKKLVNRHIDKNSIIYRKRNKKALKYLSNAKKQIGNKITFYDSLEKALYNYLKSKLQIETSEMQKDLIHQLLKEKHVKTNTAQLFLKVMKNCEMARYSPINEVKMNDDYNLAADLIELLDKEL
tara:strand:- start:8010 stop:9770 length:1761 start_codon:yes stop_codon:yes gene_type:complete